MLFEDTGLIFDIRGYGNKIIFTISFVPDVSPHFRIDFTTKRQEGLTSSARLIQLSRVSVDTPSLNSHHRLVDYY